VGDPADQGRLRSRRNSGWVTTRTATIVYARPAEPTRPCSSGFRTEALEINPAPGGTFAERERRRTELYVAFHYADPLARIIVHNLHLDADVAAMEARHRTEMIQLAERVMALGQARGEIPADRDPAFVAAMMIGGMREVLGVALSGEQWPDQEVTAAKLWMLVAGVAGVDPG
jgi:hypothetical protein